MKILKKIFSLFLLLFLIQNNVLAEVDLVVGEKLFKTNCGSCHKVDKKMTGPPLKGVTSKRSKEWIIAWVKDNVSLRKKGDIDAISIYEEYNGSPMNVFPQLSDEDILNIFSYVDETALVLAATETEKVNLDSEKEESNKTFIFSLVIIILLIIASLLSRIKNTLKHTQGLRTTTLFQDMLIYLGIFTKNKKAVVLVAILFSVFLVNAGWNFLIGIGVSQGYQPVQPISFSHKIHAGDNKIDCNYCHSSARHSRTAGIPSTNICMNCHKFIQEGPETGTTEIQKIYDAIGFDPVEAKYIEGHKGAPVKWIRVHNLPDLTYFNHSQHVTVAGLECQTCHGPVEEMEEVYQHAELTMNWCIECHQTNEINMLANPYYDKLHKDLLEQHHDSILTVDKIGGLECGKCHY